MIDATYQAPEMRQSNNLEKEMGTDFWLVAVVVALLSLSIVMVFSATVAVDSKTLTINYAVLKKHLIHIVLGLVLLLAASQVKLTWLGSANLNQVLLVFAILILAVIHVPGVGVKLNEAKRWIDLAGFRFQPVEIVKVICVVYFAGYFSRKRETLHLVSVGLFYVGGAIAAIGGLLLSQPDFSSTVVICITVGTMWFLSGIRLRYFTIGLVVVVILGFIFIWISDYSMTRMSSYIDSWQDISALGYQSTQGLIAIVRGEWFGVGLGSSIQKLFYLPHVRSDFMIAVIGEELGGMGIVCVMIVYAIFFQRAFSIGRKALDKGNLFSGFMAQGVGLLITVAAILNIGVNVAVLPTTGLTLPLLSYGGSSMVFTLFAVGLLFAVDKENKSSWRRAG